MAMQENDLRRPPQDRFEASHVRVLLEHYPENKRTLAPGEQFIQQGAHGILDRDLFVGVKGNMRIVKTNENGETELDLTVSGEGALAGEMALMAPILNTALKSTDELRTSEVKIARSASVYAGDYGLEVVQLSPEEVLEWNGRKNYPFNEMYTIVSELARKRLADADRAQAGIVDVWHLPPAQVLEVPVVAEPTMVFRGNPRGSLGSRLNRKTTNL